MEELIERMKAQAGVSTEQASKCIDVIAEFTKEKFPMFAGAIDNLFKSDNSSTKDFLD
jgi:hypothetical protein